MKEVFLVILSIRLVEENSIVNIYYESICVLFYKDYIGKDSDRNLYIYKKG